VIASDIAGNRGLLGDDHGAYFKVRDDVDLADLLCRAESDRNFLSDLAATASTRAYRFNPEVELESWRSLVEELR